MCPPLWLRGVFRGLGSVSRVRSRQVVIWLGRCGLRGSCGRARGGLLVSNVLPDGYLLLPLRCRYYLWCSTRKRVNTLVLVPVPARSRWAITHFAATNPSARLGLPLADVRFW